MATAPDTKATTVADLIREIWTANEGDMPSASKALYDAIIADKALMNEVLPAVLMAWCRDRVSNHIGSIRLAAVASASRVADADQSKRLRLVVTETLFDFPLPGGKRLGDANAIEIRDAAGSYQNTAKDAAHKARWLSKVAEKVGRKNKAESALSLTQLEQIFEDSRHEA